VNEFSIRAPSRIKGRPALLRRLRGLHMAVLRFGQHRAQTDIDRRWAAAVSTAIGAALTVARTTGE